MLRSQKCLVQMLLLGVLLCATLSYGAERFRVHRIDDRIQNTACQIGPDGHLYAVSMNYHGRTGGAQLVRYFLDSEGRPQGKKEVVHAWEGDAAAQPIGLAFDPAATPQQPIAWVALGQSLQGHSGWSDAWAGRIYRATLPPVGSSGKVNLELKITNLPHAFHTVNDIHFGPDRKLYICCGSTTTSGWEPHQTEQLLSGAILQADVASIRGTLDVKTADGGTYNPYAADAPVKLFATAIRQPYDCTWHPNGRLYACTNQNDVNGQTGSGGDIPDAKNQKPPEFLAIIERGKTYGFPNAARGEFVLMGGNPTAENDGWTEVGAYPVGVHPPPTFDPALLHRIDDIGGGSANGILSYRATGPLHQHLVCCFYSADKISTFAVGADGRVTHRDPLRDEDGQPMKIKRPLDICQHPTAGHLYVAAYGQQDKGEEGAVYFLERQSQPQSPSFSITPIALVGSLEGGDSDKWSDSFSASSRHQDADFKASADADWLEVHKSTTANREGPDRMRQVFDVHVRGSLPPGTHYATVHVSDERGQHRTLGVQVFVPTENHDRLFAVSAGNSRDVTPKELPIELPLSGSIMTAQQDGEIDVRWERVSGPFDGVRIHEPHAIRTTATFERRGKYQLQLEAAREGHGTEQATTFIIDEPGNEPPRVEITASDTKVVHGDSVRLSADADDDGRPQAIGELTHRWSREGTGIGVVDFSDATGSSTTATFSRPGTYRIRCTVSDGVREAYDEVIINCTQP